MLHYKPFYVWRLGRKVHTVVDARFLNLYVAEDPDDPVPPDDDPVPEPDPEPIPEPDPEPIPEPDDDPVPPPDDEPPPLPPDDGPDELFFPGVTVLARSTEATFSDRGLYWIKITHEKLERWEIESVEHLCATLLEKITPWKSAVAFDIPLTSSFYPIVKTFVLKHGGVVYE